jgi:hypothetical protein
MLGYSGEEEEEYPFPEDASGSSEEGPGPIPVRRANCVYCAYEYKLKRLHRCHVCGNKYCATCGLFCPSCSDAEWPPPCPACHVLVPAFAIEDSNWHGSPPLCSGCIGASVARKETWFCHTHNDLIPNVETVGLEEYWKHHDCSIEVNIPAIVVLAEGTFPVLTNNPAWRYNLS